MKSIFVLVFSLCAINLAIAQDVTPQKLLQDKFLENEALGKAGGSFKMDQVIAQHEPIQDSVYIVGPGDKFKISLLGKVSDEEYEVTVDPEGAFVIPKIGTLSTVNRTLKELKKEILSLFQTHSKQSQIIIQLVHIKSLIIPISGEVLNPGSYEFTSTVRLAEVIQKASTGGPYSALSYLPNANLRNVELMHQDGSFKTYDVEDFLKNGDLTENPFLSSGDKVTIPVIKQHMIISGSIARPGRYAYRETSLYDFIQFAGGLSANADSSNLFVTSYGSDGHSLSAKKIGSLEESKSLRLQPDDNVLIGTKSFWHEEITASIYGRVKNPGVYSLKKGSSVSDLFAQAGGKLDDADLTVTYLNRTKYNDNQTPSTNHAILNESDALSATILNIDFTEDLLSHSSDSTSVLQDGDLILVPKKGHNISVVGNVKRPGLVEHAAGKEWKYYVEECGGFNDNAYKGYSKVFKKKRGAWVSAATAGALEPGDILMIPPKPEEYPWNKFKDIVSIVTGLVSVTATVLILSK